MKITPGGITFNSLGELTAFIMDLDLLGILTLQKPIVDKAGKILLKENIVIKQSALDKLEELDGNYEPSFEADITRDVLKRISNYLADRIIKRINEPGNRYIAHLFNDTRRNYKAYVRTALRERRFILIIFKMASEKALFFHHVSELAMLSLGLVLHASARIRMIHRNTFLAGLCAHLALADGDAWRNPPEDDAARRDLLERCGSLTDKMNLVGGLGDCVRHSHFAVNKPVVQEESSVFDDFFDDDAGRDAGGGESVDTEQNGGEAEVADSPATEPDEDAPTENLDEQSGEIIAQVLKVARFLLEMARKLGDSRDFSRELVVRLAYNASRGYFDEKLIEPVIARFREYEEAARHMQRIAAVEKKCLHTSSAWAYPKPQAAQILCKDGVGECPYLVQGWDLHVVASQEAYGWIGAALPPGNYHKCKLEEDLEAIREKEA